MKWALSGLVSLGLLLVAFAVVYYGQHLIGLWTLHSSMNDFGFAFLGAAVLTMAGLAVSSVSLGAAWLLKVEIHRLVAPRRTAVILACCILLLALETAFQTYTLRP